MDSRRLAQLAATLTVLTVGAASATASPVSDVTASDRLFFDQLTFEAAGQTFGIAATCVSKRPGTLDFEINLRDFGLPRDLVLHFRGSAVGDVVTWSFEEELVPAFNVAPLHDLKRVRGSLVVDVALISGHEGRTCGGGSMRLYNVRGRERAGTSLEFFVDGPFSDWWEPAQNIVVRGLGGLAPARLTEFRLATNRVCRSPRRQSVLMSVRASGPVPSPGLPITMWSSDATQVRPVELAAIPASISHASGRLVLEPHVTGTYWISASAPGATLWQRLTIDECVREPIRYRPEGRPWWQDCWACTVVRAGLRGELLVRHGEDLLRLRGDGTVVNLTELVGPLVKVATMSALGVVAGAFADGGELRGFVVDPDALHLGASFVDLVPTGLSESGALVGEDPLTGRAALLQDGTLLPLVGLGGATVSVVGIDGAGRIAGTDVDKGGYRRAFVRGEDGVSEPIGDLGGGESQALLVSPAGYVAGIATTASGAWHPFLLGEQGLVDLSIDPASGAPLPGVLAAWPIGIDLRGRVLVRSIDKLGRVGDWMWTGGAMVPVAKLIQSNEPVELRAVLALSDDGTLVVDGKAGEIDGWFALVPADDDSTPSQDHDRLPEIENGYFNRK
jgi:hypothetical protein